MTLDDNDRVIGAMDHRVKKLEERYPFSAEELEILCRCHDHLKNAADRNDFLMKLAQTSPYQFFFLPGDEMRTRVDWIESFILPSGFANQLRAAVSMDAFVAYASQGEDKSLEHFLEGVADTGRRGSKEALRFIYRLFDQPEPEELIDVCVRLAVASDALVTPILNQEATLLKLGSMRRATESMAQSLGEACSDEAMAVATFIEWAENTVPMLHAPLATFVHNLLFHGHPFPSPRIPYVSPQLDRDSRVLSNTNQNPLLMAISMMSTHFGGKWHRVYSTFQDGRSFNRLEYSLLGYSGPTVILVKTTGQQVLGGFAADAWKDAKGEFYGNADCFLFELDPNLKVHRSKNIEAGGQNFMYMHLNTDGEACHGHPHGLGFGGSIEHPRFFIPESLERCSAGFLDRTFQDGELLPMVALETFEIHTLEVWGVGGDDIIEKALSDRAAHRERHEDIIRRARMVHDKKQFAEDMQSGLISNILYAHQEKSRGRQDLVVDDEHGGYKIEGH